MNKGMFRATLIVAIDERNLRIHLRRAFMKSVKSTYSMGIVIALCSEVLFGLSFVFRCLLCSPGERLLLLLP